MVKSTSQARPGEVRDADEFSAGCGESCPRSSIDFGIRSWPVIFDFVFSDDEGEEVESVDATTMSHSFICGSDVKADEGLPSDRRSCGCLNCLSSSCSSIKSYCEITMKAFSALAETPARLFRRPKALSLI
jgi:hypothetical protein